MSTNEEARIRKEALEELRREAAVAEAPVVQALKSAGYDVESVDDLQNVGVAYRKAVTVLVEWLPRITNSRVKEWMVRMLSVSWAKPEALEPLLVEFARLRSEGDDFDSGLAWVVGNALNVVADDSVFDELVDIVEDRSLGTARQMIVLWFKRSKRPEASRVLTGLLDDEMVNGHAAQALLRFKDIDAREGLEALLDDDRTWVRKAASKALYRMQE